MGDGVAPALIQSIRQGRLSDVLITRRAVVSTTYITDRHTLYFSRSGITIVHKEY